ncbi:unnamed protein product [Echinostoma caproni]|uniref:Velvet domain-containing protein n=1 Tax=Echinostoma caproni TaxID=27848 RepID=A0A183B178_9TREM|nr:unnamed protein product [Echinostoma caproni]
MDRGFPTNSLQNTAYPNTLARCLAQAQNDRTRVAPPLPQIRPSSRMLRSLSTKEHTCVELSEPALCDYCHRSVPLASICRPPVYTYALNSSYPIDSGRQGEDSAEDVPSESEGLNNINDKNNTNSNINDSLLTQPKLDSWPLSRDCVFYITINEDRLAGPFLFTSVPSDAQSSDADTVVQTGFLNVFHPEGLHLSIFMPTTDLSRLECQRSLSPRSRYNFHRLTLCYPRLGE